MTLRVHRSALVLACLLPWQAAAQIQGPPPPPAGAGGRLTPTSLPDRGPVRRVAFEPVFEFGLDAAPAAPAAVDATAAYVPLRTGELVAVDLLEGGVRWRVELATTLAPAAREGIVVVAGAEGLTALDAVDGSTRWTLPVPGGFSGPPLVDTGWVVVGTAAGEVLAARASDGAVIWTSAVGAPVERRPVAAASGIYVSVSDGRVVSLALADGGLRWESRLGGAPGDLLVLDEKLYVGADDKHFYCLDTDDGDRDWRQRVGGRPVGAAAVDTERVYYVALDNILWAYGRRGGSIRWRRLLSFRPSAGPAVLGDVVAVAGIQAEIHGFEVRTGELAAEAVLAADLASPPVSVPGLLPTAWRPLLLVTREGSVRLLQQRVEPAPVPMPYPLGAELPLPAGIGSE
jgi:outer membrane protein assembly factor BamB